MVNGLTYVILARFLAWINLRRAYLFNGEFEDHAERVYAQFVADNPAWEAEVVPSGYVTQYAGGVTNWADVFRRIGLDERDHRNRSFIYAGKKEYVVEYDGMPPLELRNRLAYYQCGLESCISFLPKNRAAF